MATIAKRITYLFTLVVVFIISLPLKLIGFILGLRRKSYYRWGARANRNHPAYIIKTKKDKHTFVTLTHKSHLEKELGDGIKEKQANIKLEKNPDPKDVDEQGNLRDSYVIPKVTTRESKLFGPEIKNWDNLDPKDQKKIKDLNKKK
ncbi:MAG: hypothetical protein FWB72_01730 [Firmicutes bacterium]|nr:hypothetical protein [Bacillota bacterium]